MAAKWLRQIYTEILFSLSLLIFTYFYSNFTELCEFLKRTTNLKLLDFCWFSTMLRQQLSPDTWRMSPNCAPVTCTHTELVSTQRLEITHECQHFEKVCKSSKCCPSFCWQEMSMNMVGRIWNRHDAHAVKSSLIKSTELSSVLRAQGYLNSKNYKEEREQNGVKFPVPKTTIGWECGEWALGRLLPQRQGLCSTHTPLSCYWGSQLFRERFCLLYGRDGQIRERSSAYEKRSLWAGKVALSEGCFLP